MLYPANLQLMGYKSYAEFSLHSTMAASPEVVLSFLLEMSKVVRPKADQVCCRFYLYE